MIDKTYIEMCRKAVEIQDLWKPKIGDYVSLARFPGQGHLLEIVTEGHEIKPLYQVEHGFKNQYRHELIWLPRQDQLQEILLDGCLSSKIQGEPLTNDIESVMILSNMFNDYFDDIDIRKWPHCFPKESIVSFEQLWIAFVMHEKWGKVWDSKRRQWDEKLPLPV